MILSIRYCISFRMLFCMIEQNITTEGKHLTGCSEPRKNLIMTEIVKSVDVEMMMNVESEKPGDEMHEQAIEEYRRKLAEYADVESRLKEIRIHVNSLKEEYDKTENDLKALQSVGQIVGEVLKQLTEDKFIVKATNGPRYVVGCRRSIDKKKLIQGTRVALDMTTLTIMRQLPREVDPLVYNMSHEDPGDISYTMIGGLAEQIRQLREVVELPLTNPDLFIRVGIDPPKGCLLYGPPGTGKTLLARAVASQLECNFLKVVSSAIVDKYIGESARMIREMFNYARDHQPCIIFMDEIDAIGGRRFSEGTSADREIQRTLMELLNQMDGFDALGKVKIIMATNRPDTLDPALLRPGRLDRKIEIPLPNEQARLDIIKIHAKPITKKGIIDFESVVKLSDGFSGADLRNVCTEAGLLAIRGERDYVTEEDFMKAVRKVGEAKKLESKLDYKPPYFATVGDIASLIRKEHQNICSVQFYTCDNLRFAYSAPFESLLKSTFYLRINDSVHLVQVPPDFYEKLLATRSTDVVRLMELFGTAQKSNENTITENLKLLKEELQPLENKLQILSEKARLKSKRLMWLGLGFLGIQAGILARFTWWEYSWDVMEPVTYFVTYGSMLFSYCYFLLTRESNEYPSVDKRLSMSFMYKAADRHGFDFKRYNELKENCRRLEEELRQLRRQRSMIFKA
ncbi:putative 26S protease regulatory subunit 10B [Trichinella nelsoni]|uniref:Putative 26S protease regulatory subunit 10B n=1 Tax=Trichinella nelsoni TaxID=6336 RepID=A0A0V0SNA0_9BILA|nr:putative 26S protease regulatory subunit 10B [Trichinella nelsoni]